MQTITFLQTAEWIVGLFDAETVNFFEMGSDPRRVQIMMIEPTMVPMAVPAKLTHNIAVVRERLVANPAAREILEAFQLQMLLDDRFPIELAEASTGKTKVRERVRGREAEPEFDEREERERVVSVMQLLTPLWEGWHIFTKCLTPVKRLTIPEEVAKEQDFDEVLTIELRYEDEVNPPLGTIISVFLNITELYAALNTLHGIKDYPPLRLIYADSGTSIRVDLKGLGEPIKRIKELLLESWRFIRHRKAEDFHENNKAFLEGLESVKIIKSMRDQGTLPPEDALRLTTLIIESTTKLFESGVLIREIPRDEVVSNQNLIEGYYRKLLPPMPTEHTEESETPLEIASAQPARKRRKKRKKQKPTETEPD